MIKFLGLGADPEVFLKDSNGIVRSVIGLLGGTKQEPKQMEGLPPGFMIQEDNVAAEFNIPPASNVDEWNDNIHQAYVWLRAKAKQLDLRLDVSSARYFVETELRHPDAMKFGCDPDWNVWNLKYNPRPNSQTNLRTAAGHVHISWEKPGKNDIPLVVKMCDLYLGVPSIMVTPKSDRRELYGKAGAFRYKPYGVEYRVLDNWWITSKTKRVAIYNNVMHGLGVINNPKSSINENMDDFQQEIQECINTHNTDIAQALMARFQVPSLN